MATPVLFLTEKLADANREIERLRGLSDAWADIERENHAEIERLRVALKRIDGINDNPARYNPDIDAVIRGALEQNEDGK